MKFQGMTLVLTTALALGACGAGEQAEPAGEEMSAAPGQPTSAPVDRPATTQPEPDASAAMAAEPSPAESNSAAVLPAGPLYTIQIAAYEDSGAAEQLQSFLAQEGMPAWTTTAQVDGRTYHRVRVGVLQDLAATRRLGRDLAERYGAEVWVAPVEARAAVPADAIDATRALLSDR